MEATRIDRADVITEEIKEASTERESTAPNFLSDQTIVGGLDWLALRDKAMEPDYKEHSWFVSSQTSFT